MNSLRGGPQKLQEKRKWATINYFKNQFATEYDEAVCLVEWEGILYYEILPPNHTLNSVFFFDVPHPFRM